MYSMYKKIKEVKSGVLHQGEEYGLYILLLNTIQVFSYHVYSGGVKRNWTGVPRKFQTLDENGKLSARCVCVQPDKLSKTELARIAEYDNCDASSTTCHVSS